MALNQLHYMSLSMSVIKYDDVRQRLLMNAKDEDISPFTAVDKYDFNINFASWPFYSNVSLLSKVSCYKYSLCSLCFLPPLTLY